MTSINPDTKEYVKSISEYSKTVDDLVSQISNQDWDRPTPAPKWTIRDQIGHLTFIYNIADLAVRKSQAFTSLVASNPDKDAVIHDDVRRARDLPIPELINAWRETRDRCVEGFVAADPNELVPWLVNPLPPAVLAAAGIMETFAHCHDIADALGVSLPDSQALAHVVAFAVKVRDFGYEAHGVNPPEGSFRFEITTNDGVVHGFGDELSEDYVAGSAYDFCQVVTRRRHHLDTDVVASGPYAPGWLEIAQAYRGNAGKGRRPGQFSQAGEWAA